MPYNRFAHLYDRLLSRPESLFLSRWRKEALSFLPPDSRILEIGAGTGLNFGFYPECCHAIASELSFQMLGQARRKNHKAGLIQADAQFLPFPEGYFDAAFATLVFCSIPDPAKAFGELRRVLKPESRLILLEHVRPPGFLGYIFDFLNIFTVALIADHFNRETAKIAEECGFEAMEVKTKAWGAVNLIVCRSPKNIG